jgi:hypothetical protein
MLVNTIRKVQTLLIDSTYNVLTACQDLVIGKLPRAVLALDVPIESSSADVIPAVQRKMYDIASHSSSVCIQPTRACIVI